MLKKEFQYYLANQKELVDQYNGKYIAIIGEKVVGIYETEEDAFIQSMDTHELGSFLIQKCEPGHNAYTQIFHSRAVFS